MTPVFIPGLTSIVIATYDHGRYLGDAIESVLNQSEAAVEAVVVDDGSRDSRTKELREYYDKHPLREKVRWFVREHAGAPSARNFGVSQARGEYLSFLDADDHISSDKVFSQKSVLSASSAGWVLSDTLITDVTGRQELASVRYDYAQRKIKEGGDFLPLLAVANFIPVHSTLIRRSVLDWGPDFFPLDKMPEDWHFYYQLASRSSAAYFDATLAYYTKRRGGRNTKRWKGMQVRPGFEPPLRLNLGCGMRGKDSWHPIAGFINLDKSLGWRYEEGLREFADASVSGITISHSLMFVELADWPTVFSEFARVLRPGGAIRITEDNVSEGSRHYPRGWQGSESAVTLTTPELVGEHLAAAGLGVFRVDKNSSNVDSSLMQSWHDEEPHVFYIEGLKPSCLLFSPHCDDESLFASFTIIREHPRVIVCFPSSDDYGSTSERMIESANAVAILGGGPVYPPYLDDAAASLEERMRLLDMQLRPNKVYAPSARTSHPDHLLVAQLARKVFGDRVVAYHTYDRTHAREHETGKVREGVVVPFESSWLELKRRALACYNTQLNHPRAKIFFGDDYSEYQEAPNEEPT